MGQRRKFSTEYKREAVAMLDAPGVSQITADLGIGAMVLGRWRRELLRQGRHLWVTGDPVMRSWPSFVGS